MQITQFEDKNLSHYSYAILSEQQKKIVLIDPARNTRQYIDFAKNNEAEIIKCAVRRAYLWCKRYGYE